MTIANPVVDGIKIADFAVLSKIRFRPSLLGVNIWSPKLLERYCVATFFKFD